MEPTDPSTRETQEMAAVAPLHHAERAQIAQTQQDIETQALKGFEKDLERIQQQEASANAAEVLAKANKIRAAQGRPTV